MPEPGSAPVNQSSSGRGVHETTWMLYPFVSAGKPLAVLGVELEVAFPEA